MDDAPISPITPVEAEAVEPVDPAGPNDPASPPPAVGSSPTFPAGDHEVHVGARAERAQLEHPVTSPASTGQVADVHDAAEHGNPMAAAIERARTSNPTDRAQQQGGAAASSASGQSTPPPPPASRDMEEEGEPKVDPLAPVDGA